MTGQETQSPRPASPRGGIVTPARALFPRESAGAAPAVPADEGARTVTAVRARRSPDPQMQNARRSRWLRYILPVLAMLYLGVMAYRRSAPVVRVVTSWAQSANPQHWEYGIGAISATVLLWYFAGQAQLPRGWGNATPRGETTPRRPATDGDHGREREGAPGSTRTPPRAGSPSQDIPNRNVVDAMVETRGTVLSTKEDLLTAIRSLPH